MRYKEIKGVLEAIAVKMETAKEISIIEIRRLATLLEENTDWDEGTYCICKPHPSHSEVNAMTLSGQMVKITGHLNDTGGYCCPHYGNTCGIHKY